MTIKVHELAKEVSLTSKEVQDKLNSMGKRWKKRKRRRNRE